MKRRNLIKAILTAPFAPFLPAAPAVEFTTSLSVGGMCRAGGVFEVATDDTVYVEFIRPQLLMDHLGAKMTPYEGSPSLTWQTLHPTE